jgi:uncharacterized membrane protein
MPIKLSVKECLTFGWKTFKARPWFFVGTFLIYALIQILLSVVQERMPGIISFLLSIGVSSLLSIGLIHTYFKAHTDVLSPRFADLWNPKPFWTYLGTSILLGIIVVVGLILLIVPGVIAALALAFSGYLVVYRGMKPIEALKESARLTKGNRSKLFLLGLSLIGLAILGAIPLFLGLLVVGPVSMLAGIHAYRTLEKSAVAAPAPESVPAAA